MVKVVLLGSVLSLARSAPAAAQSLQGGNTDFPDQTLVMPFAAIGARSTFFSISNCWPGDPITATWTFYDASGLQIAQVNRAILGACGTDIVNIQSVADRTYDGSTFTEGPAQSLVGHDGFVVVSGDSNPRFIGNFTMANLTTNSAFGVDATGFGSVGALAQGGVLLGTSFSPSSLQDNLLVILALNSPAITSLTNGGAPPDQPLFVVDIQLIDNGATVPLAETKVPVTGTALFASLETLFPGVALNSSLSLFISATEGAGFSGTALDPDSDNGIGIIGYYGQAVGPFGAGQTLRAGAFFQS
jgi:hypothetical protein